MKKPVSSRDYILGRIRKGLAQDQLPMPFPEDEGAQLENVYVPTEISAAEKFALEFSKLGGKFVYCQDELELTHNLIALQDHEDWKMVLCSDPYLLSLLKDAKIDFVEPADRNKHMADACITPCASLVARTGSILFTSREPLGRMAPVFFPVHIVVAYVDQLTDDIAPALENLVNEDQLPSMINLNTGPSRTADIEKTLVVGVHGPGEVFCFLVGQRGGLMH